MSEQHKLKLELIQIQPDILIEKICAKTNITKEKDMEIYFHRTENKCILLYCTDKEFINIEGPSDFISRMILIEFSDKGYKILEDKLPIFVTENKEQGKKKMYAALKKLNFPRIWKEDIKKE